MKFIKVSKDKILMYIYIITIFAGVTKTYLIDSVDTTALPVQHKNIVIDAGHGG